MASHHSLVACKAIPSRAATVIATFYAVDNQLRHEIISGDAKQPSFKPDLPDEGVYIIYKNRGLQIAAPPCDQRKCNVSQLCRCDAPHFSAQGVLVHRRNIKKRAVDWPRWKPCCNCLFNWLRLFPAMEAANNLNMKCLQHPRTLTLANLDDQQAFHYDSELEEQPIHSTNNGITTTDGKSCCPTRLFEWMCDAWKDFVNCGCCKPGSITALSDYEDESCDGFCSDGQEDCSDTDSDWDDLDIPRGQTSPSSLSESDDYDFINDLIEEEFPKLQKSSPVAKKFADFSATSNQSILEKDDGCSDEEGDMPAPIVIPPKGLTIARGLRTSTRLENSPSMQPTDENSISIADSQYVQLQPDLGKKRPYHDLVRHGQCDVQPADEDSRVKQRKLDISMPQTRNWHRQSSSSPTSFLQLNQIQQGLIFT
ncbi:hypothetical protein F5Y06DRAFT_294487 [Hypoxylon sp. FL0890]|nr:hypothetical protein F5Y06DRAFT_294487 [Hypoxylon sp. FL0890]